jgi:DNA-directed RNA polymerase specialized sigma24 family protein
MNAFISTVIKNACIDELRKSKDEQLDDNLEYIHSVDLKISDELLQ